MAAMSTRYGRSPWIDRFPSSRIPTAPAHRGHLDTSVVIVGGGLTGCATAYAFAAAGIKVGVLDADRVGRGSTGGAAGWIADDPGAPFAEIEQAHGLRTARRAWQAWRRAALDFASLLRRLEINCDLEPRSTITIGTTADQIARLRREQKSRIAAG